MLTIRKIQRRIVFPGKVLVNHFGSTFENATILQIPSLIDNFPIDATLFHGKSSSKKKTCVIVSSATGSRRQFYFPWAEFLSTKHDLDVLTYDYRGTHVRQSTDWTLVEHWARRDCAGIISYCAKHYDEICYVGHSLGGNILSVLPPSINELLDRVLLISAANSYFMYRKWNKGMLGTILSLHLLREPLILFFGYFPIRTVFRSGVDMPKGIARQWARWVRFADCFVDEQGKMYREGFDSVRCPILALNFNDDQFYKRIAFERFTRQFLNATTLETWHLPKGGHFHFFKESQPSTLWNDVAEYCKTGRIHLTNDQRIL